MGAFYYLKILKNKSGFPDKGIIQHFRKSNTKARDMLDADGCSDYDRHWSDSQADLVSFSKLYPDVLFELRYEDEDDDYRSKTYVQDGKKQVAEGRVVYDFYDPDKME